ncbi:MAG: hypothetical protein GYA14_14080 [Ignavibacteria bacterium]|nr:hypothetical protein [Ignavibacteria bacterium]
MATYNKIFGGGNYNAQNVIKIVMSNTPAEAPFLKAWDDTDCDSVEKEIFTGTTGNSNEPMIIAKETTSGTSGSNWVTSVTKQSEGASSNKLKGNDNYLVFPNTNTTQYFNIALLLPCDITLGSYTATLQFIGYFSASTTITWYFNNATNGGTEASPSWSTWGNYSIYFTGANSSTSTMKAIIIPQSGNAINDEEWIQVS